MPDGARGARSQRLDPGQRLALDELQRGAAAGREVVDRSSRPKLRAAPRPSRRRRRPSRPARRRPPRRRRACPRRTASSSNAPIGPFQNTVPAPRDRLGVGAPRSRGPMSRPIQPVGDVDAVQRARAARRRRGGRRDEIDRQQRARARRAGGCASSAARACSTSSSSHSERADRVALRARNGKHIAPPIRSVSASSRKRSITRDLVGHLGAAEHRHQGPRRIREHRLSVVDLALEQQPGARLGSRCVTPSVDACARWAEPNASLT